MKNKLASTLYYEYNYKAEFRNFTTQIDNCCVSFSSNYGYIYITVSGDVSTQKLLDIFHEILSILFINLGVFPVIEKIEINGNPENLSEIPSKFTPDDKFKKTYVVFGNIDQNMINQTVVNEFRKIPQEPLASMQYLVSLPYENINITHRLLLLLHVVDGLIDDKVVDIYKKKAEQKNYIPQRYTGKYLPKCYYLFDNYFFNYHRKYNCKILNVLHMKREIFLKAVTDTRNTYTHFLGEKKVNTISDGDRMLILFFILLYVVRLYLASRINIKPSEDLIKEFYYAIHDWILHIDKKLTLTNCKSKIYKKMLDSSQELFQN